MTYTKEQRRDALAWADAVASRRGMGCACGLPCNCTEDSENCAILAAALRQSESDLSALRAENEALKKAADNFRMHHIGCGWRESAEAAEAKVAKMEQRWRQSCGDDFVDRALASLRETEGGAK